jgi:predicted ATPase
MRVELVGREEELEVLLRRWANAKTGEGQVVLLSGEPGIGKSRLTGTVGSPRCRTTHSVALFLLTAAHRQRPVSNY